MEFKRLISQFTYHIEAKPEGGFIARAGDPTLPPLEAPTQMELRQKIQDSINAAIATQFPGLKLPPNNRVSFHLERQSDGTLAFHSSDPNSPATGAAPHEEVESRFAEKLIGLFGKHFIAHLPPEIASQLPQEFAAQIGSGDVKVFVGRNIGGQSNVSPSALPGTPQQTMNQNSPIAPQFSNTISNSNFAINASDNSPITPARSNAGPIVRFLLTLLLLFGIMYVYLHFRHR
jgi:hypothetical protein